MHRTYTYYLVQYLTEYSSVEKICRCDSELRAITIAKSFANEIAPVMVVRMTRDLIDDSLQDVADVFTQPKITRNNGGEQND